MAKVSKARDHRANRLLAALGPEDYAVLAQNLEVVALPGRKVLYEPGETIEHAYFPHDAIISLIAVFADGGSFGDDLELGKALAISAVPSVPGGNGGGMHGIAFYSPLSAVAATFTGTFALRASDGSPSCPMK